MNTDRRRPMPPVRSAGTSQHYMTRLEGSAS